MRVTIDLMKKSTQIIDLSNVINPRVGDDDLLLPLHIVYGDNQTDMRGKDVEFISEDTNKQRIYVGGTCNTNTPGDNLYMGNLTFRFPAGTFKADGTYDPDKTMFRIVDKATNKVISSVNVKITVMKNSIEFDFDPDNTSYDSRLEKMLHGFHDEGQAMLDDIKNLNDQAKSNVSGDTAATANAAKKQADQNAGDISDMQGEIAGARGRFADMAGREDAQDAAINQKESIVNANANYAELKRKDAQQDVEIANKAEKFELEEKLADSVGAIQAQIDAGNVATMNRHIHDYDKLETDFTNANNKITEAKSQLTQLTKAPNVDSSTELGDARVAAGSLGGDTYPTVGQAIRAQADDLATSMSQLGVYSKKFSVKANMSHSSTVDQLPVRIKKGESYSVKTVTTLSSPANLKLFEINSGDEYVGQNVGATTDTTVNYVAKEDVTKLGWSIDPVNSDYDIYIIVTKSDSVLNKAEENQSDLTMIKGDAAFAKLSLLLSKDNEHSSTTDQVAVDLKEGDVYQVFFSSPADSEAVQVMEFSEDGKGDKALVIGNDGKTHSPNATTNGIFEYVAQKDVSKIGVYVAAPSATGILDVLITKKNSARQQLVSLTSYVSDEQTIASGVSLSSSKNGLYIPLEKGTSYNFTYYSDVPVNVQLFEYDLYDLSGGTKTLQFNSLVSGNQNTISTRKCNFIGVFINNPSDQEAHVKYSLALEGSKQYTSATFKQLISFNKQFNNFESSVHADLIGNDLLSIAPVDDDKLAEYANLFCNASSNTEQFIYFTDPHPMHFGWNNELNTQTYLALQHYYNSTPTAFALSGGDWLQSGQTPTQAAVTIGRINGLTKHLFNNNFYTVLGNHDSNYQGIDDAGTPRKGTLSQQALADLWFPRYHRCYYSFDGFSTKFYILDSGSDWDTKMNDYRFEQVYWLAQQLIANNDAHSAIAVHIWWNLNEDTVPTPFAQTITQVIEAYNAHGSVTINGKSYDFSGKNGRVEFVLCGHLHIDRNGTAAGIPVVASLNATETTGYGFELVLADYDKRSLTEVRVGGRGSSRVFSLDN